MHHANVQSDAIADHARQLLQDKGWGVLAREEELRHEDLIGHLDIRAWHSAHGEAIIDLKTGQNIGAAWLQVGGYLYLDIDISKVNAPTMPMWGGVLHVPRTRIDKDVKGTLAIRPADGLYRAWCANLARITRIVTENAPPTYSPGVHCGRCRVSDCPVRIGDAP